MNFSGLVHEDRFPEGLRVHLLGLFTNADELRRRYGTRDSATHEELLAASYRARGSACVDELEGEYAFVVIDGRERIVLCGRDRLGLKPLYYRLRTQNGVKDLAFATTLASARAWPGFAPTPDLNALAFSLAEVHFDQSLTWYQNVSALPQAHALLWQDGRARIFRYWTPGLGKVLALANHGEYLEHAHELFRRAVGARLTELQGPVSVFLSGGLDSGLVAKLAEEKLRSEHHDRAALLHTHSAICRAGAADESAGIARTISGAAWRAHTLEVSPDNPILDIPEPGRLRDVTYAPHNFFGIPLLEDMQARDIHTVFSGYGGDDVFSPGLFAAEFLRRGRVVSAVGAVNELSYPGDNKLNVFWTHGVRPLLVGLRNRYMASALKRPVSSLLSPEFDQKAGISVAYNEYLDRNRASEGDLPRRNLYRKFFVRGGYPIGLAKDHELCSLFGVVQYHPLLDENLIRLAFELPLDILYGNGDSKHVLRQIAARYLSRETVTQPNYVDYAPFVHAVLRRQRPAIERLLRAPRLLKLGLLNPYAWRYLKADPFAARHNSALLTFLDIEQWLLGLDFKTHGGLNVEVEHSPQP